MQSHQQQQYYPSSSSSGFVNYPSLSSYSSGYGMNECPACKAAGLSSSGSRGFGYGYGNQQSGYGYGSGHGYGYQQSGYCPTCYGYQQQQQQQLPQQQLPQQQMQQSFSSASTSTSTAAAAAPISSSDQSTRVGSSDINKFNKSWKKRTQSSSSRRTGSSSSSSTAGGALGLGGVSSAMITAGVAGLIGSALLGKSNTITGTNAALIGRPKGTLPHFARYRALRGLDARLEDRWTWDTYYDTDRDKWAHEGF